MNAKAHASKKDSDKTKKRPMSPNADDLEVLQSYLGETKEKLEAQTDKRSASLLEELSVIEKKLVALKGTKLSLIQSRAIFTDIDEINKKAEKSKWSLLSRLVPKDKEISVALITVIGTIIVAIIAQKANTPASPTTTPGDTDKVAVSFINPKTNAAIVRLVISQDGEEVLNLDIPPGGTVPVNNLSSGDYQFDIRPIYPAMTPLSANCSVQWEQGDSYKGDLAITSTKAVIQIKHFDLVYHEVCSTETPVPPPLTPSQ